MSESMARSISLSDGSTVVAVAWRDEMRTRDFARRPDIPRHYTDHAALVADGEVDIVYVAVPNNVHHI